MEIDREYQRRFLEELDSIYPDFKNFAYREGHEDEKKRYENFFYLREHGLIEGEATVHGSGAILFTAKLMHKGIDFLKCDGGLSAILGVVTVKLHEDTLRHLIQTKIDQSNLEPHEKHRAIDALKALPVDATKHLIMRLLDKGLDDLPGLLRLIDSTTSAFLV